MGGLPPRTVMEWRQSTNSQPGPSVTVHLSLGIASQNQLLEPSYASHCALEFAALQCKAEPAVVGYPGPGAAVYAQARGSEDGFPDVTRIQLALKAISFEVLPDVGSRLRQHRDATATAGNVPATALQRLFITQRKCQTWLGNIETTGECSAYTTNKP
jgi:hypothetical protein